MKMKRFTLMLMIAATLALGVATPGEAWHWAWPHAYPYWDPYVYPYGYGYGPPVVVQRAAPQVYVQPPPQQYWYWCDNPKGYHPYIQQCPPGWMQVVPPTSPPSATR